ncbi:hypothetical protein AB6A40_011490 [Gnathostoma spinigerum]|uniref:C2H2-type domain-containing protein n=1 Tax=Gnathostoma spinigerum TaxID=75299 RepID=A0ABD6EZD2_9BILA
MESERKQAKHQSRKCMKRHVCRECNAAFSFPNKLRVHIQAVHSMSHECDHCGRKFNRFNQLRTHVSFVHRIRHKCEVCDYSSSVKAEVKKHFIINHQNGVRCTVDGCGITIAYNRLRRHIREKHTVESKGVVVSNDCSEPILNCNQCNFIGSNGEDISIHLEKAHGGGLLCPVLNCKKRMMLCDLKSHLDTTHCELEVELPERHLQGDILIVFFNAVRSILSVILRKIRFYVFSHFLFHTYINEFNQTIRS